VAVLVITLIFIAVYIANIASARKMLAYKKAGQKAPGIVRDLKSLLDEKFHVTLMTPSIIGILMFTVLPLIFMILIAFTNYDKDHQPPGNLFKWVGIDNFVAMLGANKLLSGTFFPVLAWTLVWAFIATFSNYILGILLSLLII
jgi:arabinogalactan oligomer/maltooligosaccharide transport system permease protein